MEEDARYVLCVCTANVCRSPMAEVLLRHALKAEDEPLRSLEVISAGVSAYEGNPCTTHSVRVLSKVGLDLSTHRSRPLTHELLDKSVLVIGMTESHRQIIQRNAPNLKAPVILMRELMPGTVDPEVPDPYGSDLRTYEATRDAIVEAIPSVVNYLKELLETPREDARPR